VLLRWNEPLSVRRFNHLKYRAEREHVGDQLIYGGKQELCFLYSFHLFMTKMILYRSTIDEFLHLLVHNCGGFDAAKSAFVLELFFRSTALLVFYGICIQLYLESDM
jgi:hypothetical protein